MEECLLLKMRSHVLSRREKEEMLEALTALLVEHEEILFAYAHGSFLEDGPFRDLDVAVWVEGHPPRRFEYEDGLVLEFAHKRLFTFPLDIRVLNDAPIAFQRYAIGGRLLIDRNPDLRLNMVTRVISRYLDIKPILEHHLREAFISDPQS